MIGRQPITLPLIVFVTGLSCTGKTTLAHTLSEKFRLPLFHKDSFKERMFDSACPDGDYEEKITRQFSQLLGRFSIDCLEIVLEQCVSSRISAVFEANFSSQQFSPRIALLREHHPFRIVQVHLYCDGNILLERFITRESRDRHPGHSGLRHLDAHRDTLLRGNDEPLVMSENDELIGIDTTDLTKVDYEPIFHSIDQHLTRI